MYRSKVKFVLYPEQEQAYYDAKARGDVYAMNLFYRPPIYRPLEQIESDLRFEELCANFEAEQKRIKETPNEILALELKAKYGWDIDFTPVKSRRKGFFANLYYKMFGDAHD